MHIRIFSLPIMKNLILFNFFYNELYLLRSQLPANKRPFDQGGDRRGGQAENWRLLKDGRVYAAGG